MVALAMDMTARNVQDAVKKKGLPWSTAKGFDTFSPVGLVSHYNPTSELTIRPFIPKSKIPSVADVGLQFSINGQVKQAGTAKDMIFGVPKLISFVSSIMRLEVRRSICYELTDRRETLFSRGHRLVWDH